MSQENCTSVPTPFRGLRILLLDNDTTSLLGIASMLEDYSYRVTTTELPTIALSILQERADRFDLVMADINMREMDCFKFIKTVQLIKDFPVILMSTELKKDMVEEAIIKGVCFFLKKPISPKSLKNVWQHVYRKTMYENSIGDKAEIKSNEVDQSQGAKVEEKENVLEVVDERTSRGPERERVGGSDENDIDDHVGRRRSKKLTGIRKKRSRSSENDEPVELKRKRTEDEDNQISRTVSILSGQLRDEQVDRNLVLEEDQEFADSCHKPTSFLKLLQEATTSKGPNFCEHSHFQSKLSTGMAVTNQKLDLVPELATSSYRLNQGQLNAKMKRKERE